MWHLNARNGECVGETVLKHIIVSASPIETFEEIAEKLHMEHPASVAIISRKVEQRRLARLQVETSEENFLATCPSLADTAHEDIFKAGTGTVIQNTLGELRELCTASGEHDLH